MIIPLTDLRKICEDSWTIDTTFCPEKYLTGNGWVPNKAIGQCGVTSVFIQEVWGGEILTAMVQGQPHYFNVINGIVFDLTWRQFDSGADMEDIKPTNTKFILFNPWFVERYQNFKTACMNHPLYKKYYYAP